MRISSRRFLFMLLLCGLAFLGNGALAEQTPTVEDAAFQAGIAQFRVVQQALAQGKLDEAKAACSALLQRQDLLPHHRWEAEERLKEIERMQEGLPARDPAAHRLVLPKRPDPAVRFFVAPDGNDENPGTQEKPFRTLERVRDAIRSRKQAGELPRGGVEVAVRGGEYAVSKALELTAQDSGTEAAPIVYRACDNEKPVFRGGVRVTGFQPATDADVLARLPEESRGKVLCADLKPLGLREWKPLELGGFASKRGFKTHPTAELFFDGRAMPLSRWPNQGFVAIKDIVVQDGEKQHGIAGSKTGRFSYDGDRPQRWLKEKDAWLYGYWFYGWADSYEPITSIDPANKEIALAEPYPTYGFRKGQPFCAMNLLAEIDMPGEWYLDRANSALYFWPPSDPSKAVVELSVNDFPFVSMERVSSVSLEGITWELAAGDALTARHCDHCLVAGCTIRRCGGDGIKMVDGTDNGVLSCDIYSMGRGGIVISGGDRQTLTPGRCFVENCDISDLSRIDHTYTPAIVMSGVGDRIAHNALHDIPSSAIRLGGNDHLVEYNDVFRVVSESDDQGGTDMFGDPLFRGNVFRFNYWHHLGNWQHPNEGPECGQGGIRLDDAISGVLIYGNVFYRASAGKHGFGGVQIHGGKDNILDNNIFVDCESAVSLSPWGESRWREFCQLPNGLGYNREVVDMKLYTGKYPDIATLAENCNRNTVARNLVVQCRKFFCRDAKYLHVFDNLEMAEDPGFRNLAAGDLRLNAASSQAGQLGLRPIALDEIGLYVDAFRKDAPRAP